MCPITHAYVSSNSLAKPCQYWRVTRKSRHEATEWGSEVAWMESCLPELPQGYALNSASQHCQTAFALGAHTYWPHMISCRTALHWLRHCFPMGRENCHQLNCVQSGNYFNFEIIKVNFSTLASDATDHFKAQPKYNHWDNSCVWHSQKQHMQAGELETDGRKTHPLCFRVPRTV